MGSPKSKGYVAGASGVIRAARFTRTELVLPAWPDESVGQVRGDVWARWVREAWSCSAFADAVGHASPQFERAVLAVCGEPESDARSARRTALALARYAARMSGRAAPVGLMAGVAPAAFAAQAHARWGVEHRAVASADAGWLAAVIATLEHDRPTLMQLPVMTNSSLLQRGGRILVPHQTHATERGASAVDVSVRETPAVRATVAAARTAIRARELVATLSNSFPGAGLDKAVGLIQRLIEARVLISGLHAPSTEAEAVGHLLAALERLEDPPPAMAELREIKMLLGNHACAGPVEARDIRVRTARRMQALAPSSGHPVALDLHMDADVSIPQVVVHEVERAADLLGRISRLPFGTQAWNRYFARFYERFGTGSLVPLTEVVAESGIGWPEGYPGGQAAPKSALTRRDVVLMTLAQQAALDGTQEVVLDEETIRALEHEHVGAARLPAHFEARVRVDARNLEALGRGRFQVTVLSISRGAGVLSGRFRHVLDPEQIDASCAHLPTPDADTVYAQLSFPPLDPATAHVARAPQQLPLVISLGEHFEASPGRVLGLDDLAVGCDSHRFYLAAPSLGVRVEAWAMHALNLRRHTPPLARLITEISRGQYAQVTAFDWGAAESLPFLPRLRYGRIVLRPARWRLLASDLPPRSASEHSWNERLAAWLAGRRVPDRVLLTDADTHLPLDLKEPMYRAILRDHLRAHHEAVLTEASEQGGDGWSGGRAVELVVPLIAARPAVWPRLPRPTPARVIHTATDVQDPAASRLLLAAVYAPAALHDEIIGTLPDLVDPWSDRRWWFVRYHDQDGRDCLRLRVRLTDAEQADFAEIAEQVAAWAARLRRAGLVRELVYKSSYPQTGRFGTGAALEAVEAFFAADSRLTLAQLAWRNQPDPMALAAANFAAISVAFTGGTEPARHWITESVPAAAPSPVPRPVLAEAVRLADPRDDFAALRALAGTSPLMSAFAQRAALVSACRAHYPGPDSIAIDPSAVLGSLLHTHFLRAYGVDAAAKRTCLHLTRAAALAADARTRAAR